VKWGKRAARLVLLLLLAELLFFFVLGTRIRRKLERPREILGAAQLARPGRSASCEFAAKPSAEAELLRRANAVRARA
jgi:hypothetical protein